MVGAGEDRDPMGVAGQWWQVLGVGGHALRDGRQIVGGAEQRRYRTGHPWQDVGWLEVEDAGEKAEHPLVVEVLSRDRIPELVGQASLVLQLGPGAFTGDQAFGALIEPGQRLADGPGS